MKKTAICVVACSMFALAACGGGGGDDAVNGDVAQKYVGSWLSNCADSDVVSDEAPTVALKHTLRLTFSQVSDNQLSYVQIEDIYPASGCTGTPLASQTNDASGNSLTINGAGTADGVAVDQVTVERDNVGGIRSGGTIHIGHLIYPGNYFIRTSTNKDITEVKDGALRFGDDSQDAQGYPSKLDPVEVFTKQ